MTRLDSWSFDGFYRSLSGVQNSTSLDVAPISSLRACHGQVTGHLELAGLETLVARPRAYSRCLMIKSFGCEQSHTLESLVLKHGVTKLNLWREAAADFFVVDVELLVDLCRNIDCVLLELQVAQSLALATDVAHMKARIHRYSAKLCSMIARTQGITRVHGQYRTEGGSMFSCNRQSQPCKYLQRHAKKDLVQAKTSTLCS